MPGNTFGQIFRVTTFGESHGPAVGAVIDGCPPRIPLAPADIQTQLDRRRPGQSAITSPRAETDRVEILSGVFEGMTTGTPIALLIRNRDSDPSAYAAIKDKFRPGHADFTFLAKYGIRDWRGSGRASGRETAGRVAAGAVAARFLAARGITCTAFTLEIGAVTARTFDRDRIESNPVRCPDPDAAAQMIALLEQAREQGDSLGGTVELRIQNCPPGLGDPVFEKLDARLAFALMSIGAVKGIEIGDGFQSARMKGSEFNDPFYCDPSGRIRTETNHCGGILGGISTGEEIVARIAVRPPASIAKRQRTVRLDGAPAEIEVRGRHDPCIVPRIVPVVEAMAALVIADALLIHEAADRLPSPEHPPSEPHSPQA